MSLADDFSDFWRDSKLGIWMATRGTIVRYLDGVERYRAGRLSCGETAESLGISERHFRGGHYFPTPKTGGKIGRVHLTQVGRALAKLKIDHIPSYSPGARSRRQPVSAGSLHSRAQPPLRGRHGRTGQRLRAAPRRAARRPVHSPRGGGRQLQLRALPEAGVADPRAASSPAFR